MKTVIFLVSFLIFALTSCERKTSKIGESFNGGLLTSGDKLDTTIDAENGLVKTQYFPISFGSEEKHVLFPFPSNWYKKDPNDSNVAIQSPDGIKVFIPIILNYSHFKEESQNEEFTKLGYPIAPIRDIHTFISEELVPLADSVNVQLINRFELIKGTSITKIHDALTIATIKPEATAITRMAVEGMCSDGTRSLIIVEHFVKKYKDLSSWGVLLHSMEAPAALYEDATSLFIESIGNFQPCFHDIFRQNKIAIHSITNNTTAQYFTPKQEEERRSFIWAEQKRTGTYEYDSFEQYLTKLKDRNVSINTLAIKAMEKMHPKSEEKNEHNEYTVDNFYNPREWNVEDTLSFSSKK